ncbi:HAD-IIB family hydrolase [Agromyces intestinalis]|uniref:HAD-IIB family hydrolase n=1 Tax=Agromyces intestinalis TaxID=2592652 RepID=A0A5C1YBS3_9MICO|nr:HAD-IIB family hydrolase [Agromyces intestinalis]QEO13008.1 HAD-IIB family hydrolase [Agromyces intestinalis]
MTSATDSRTLYVTDLDGTLLRSDGSVSSESARMLNALIDDGILFTYATARSFLGSRKATATLRLRLPVIAYGGTVTADPDTGEHLDLRLLDERTVEAALRLCAAHDSIEPIVHTFERGRDWVRWRPERVTAGVRTFLEARPGDPRLRPITREDPLDTATVFYVAIIGPNAVLTELRDALLPSLGNAAHFLSVDQGTPGLDWLEIHDGAGTKARAIHRLMRRLGADRVVVFGDNHNDLPMFEIADASYAVANAVPAVRAAATGVIGGNDEDAVARWIAEHVASTQQLSA